MAQAEKEPQEIRLFGDKSIREEAYRQKILQLEKELQNLEAIARESNRDDTATARPEVQLKGLYYESLLSFDKRARKEQEFLEKKAAEITDRLDTHAQKAILNIESSLRSKAIWLFVSVILASLLILFVSCAIFLILRPQVPGIAYLSNVRAENAPNRYKRSDYIKAALQTQSSYRHHYNVTSVESAGGLYAIEIELNAPPENKWFLNEICTEMTETLRRYAPHSTAEFSIFHKGRLYLKAFFEAPSKRLHFEYFF